MRAVTRLLVANRGEIASRIMRTAAAMGIETVAVYADGDADAPFVREADTALPLGGETAADSYLSAERILTAARRAGADAVHPGYGFLSENAEFASAVVAAGMVWVGPPPKVIAAMGDKLAAKRLMVEAGVPVLPSVELRAGGPDGSLDGTALAEAAEAVGLPAIVKAAAGGGGRGMRQVGDAADLPAAVAAAKREAGAAFGDPTVFLERLVTGARHVEIQILGDSHGTLVHCFERECSVQRRYQKIIEEAPSPAVGAELRARLGRAAVNAARAVGYESAGTVEFLLAAGGEFYFLEVNTRLQVEHPVTELVTGLDLVREQLLVAQGERLTVRQRDLAVHGHAVEARLYAEDPRRDFLPTTGTVAAWVPAATPPVRVDAGIARGSVVGTAFDPLLAKVVAHAPTRAEAVRRLALALSRTRVHGVVTNRDFLVATLRHPAFLAGDTTTDFVERTAPARARLVSPDEIRLAAVAAALAARHARRAAAGVLASLPGGWRNSVLPPEEVTYAVDGEQVTVAYRPRRDGGLDVVGTDADACVARVHDLADGWLDLELDGVRHSVTVHREGPRWWVQGPAGELELVERPRLPVPDAAAAGPGGADGGAGGRPGGRGSTSPLPGRVTGRHVEPGQRVEPGQLLFVVEAMKMEHRITARTAGTVTAVLVAAGEQVAADQLLATLEDAQPHDDTGTDSRQDPPRSDR